MLTRSLELLKDPRDQSAAWNRLGDVRRQMNNYEAAMFAYQKAELLEPGSRPAGGDAGCGTRRDPRGHPAGVFARTRT